ncbi:carbohydrate kinase family protein, partial [Aeromicrobium sp.]
MTILVMGDVVDDIVVRLLSEVTEASDTNAEIRMLPGGSAANVAAWLGHLGADVRFLGKAGASGVERHRAELAQYGVDARIAGDPQLDTATIVLTVDLEGERTMYVDRAANAAFGPADIPIDAFDGVDWLHLTGHSLFDDHVRPTVLRMIEEAKVLGAGVSIDPSSLAFLRGCGDEAFAEWARRADLLFPNLDEGRFLSGQDNTELIAADLATRFGAVVLKLGPMGAIYHDGTTAIRGQAAPGPIIDTTGAGDAYCAGFLAEWVRKSPVTECMELGARTAGQAISHMGARPIL